MQPLRVGNSVVVLGWGVKTGVNKGINPEVEENARK